uniref:Uncharacterized protein n=1 Tax=Anopheles farauti TaxID=69004 RepID=A0A182QXE6_9DIPT
MPCVCVRVCVRVTTHTRAYFCAYNPISCTCACVSVTICVFVLENPDRPLVKGLQLNSYQAGFSLHARRHVATDAELCVIFVSNFRPFEGRCSENYCTKENRKTNDTFKTIHQSKPNASSGLCH